MRFLVPTIACALFTSQVFADSTASCCPVAQQCCPKMSKPCGITYDLYGTFVFLQPNGSDLYYGAEAIGLDPDIAVPATSPNWTVLEVDPDYEPGFVVGASLFLNNANLNIDLNWERLHAQETESFQTSLANGFMVGPVWDIGPNSEPFKIATGQVASHFDAVNLTFGKNLCFFGDFSTYFYGGAGFARIRQVIDSSWSNVSGTISRSTENTSTFTGAGPEIGLDYKYRISGDFFFTGNSEIALLMGQLKNHTTFQSFSPEIATLGNPQPNVQNTNVPNRTQLIPAFVQKLGFSYLAAWGSALATFEAGYQCQIYINAVQTIDMTAPQVLPAGAAFTTQVGVFAVGFERTLSNYMLTGPYGSLSVEF